MPLDSSMKSFAFFEVLAERESQSYHIACAALVISRQISHSFAGLGLRLPNKLSHIAEPATEVSP